MNKIAMRKVGDKYILCLTFLFYTVAEIFAANENVIGKLRLFKRE